MEVLLKINGPAKDFRADSLKIESVITSRVDTCAFTLEGEQTLVPKVDEVVISNPAETVRYFAGILAEVTRTAEGLTKLYECDCQDYSFLLDGKIVNREYDNQTDAYILNDLFTTYLPEIDASTYVATGQTFERIKFNRVTLRQAVEAIASQTSLDWYIDYNKNLHYFTAETNAAPFGISDTPDMASTFPCSNLKYKKDGTKIVNMVTVVGGSYLSEDTEVILGSDGVATSVPSLYRWEAPAGYDIIRVWKNTGTDASPVWTEKTVGPSSGSFDDYDVLYDAENSVLEWYTAPPDLTQSYKIEGRQKAPLVVRVRSTASYAKYGRWFEGKVTNQDIDNRVWGMLVGKGELAENAFEKETGNFYCLQDGLVSGQLLYIHNDLYGLDGYYLVNKVVTTILGGEYCQYQVSFGEYNPDLVDLLVAAKSQAQYTEISDDEVLVELIEQQEDLAFDEDTGLQSDDFSGGIVNRWLALPPAQSKGCNVEHELLALAESTAVSSHAKGAYTWGNFKWDFFTWG
jgi:hypothetical protein